ncbi:hypothetical protein [Roseateles microcysteis]|uniref:hypothetical protein n=1 Tax=Roseateles microcysteis TaxID=3119057 RepID=UPI002FE638E2
MLFPPDITQQIVNCAHWADKLVRADLIEGIIVSENDYTSNFTSALRREIDARAIPGLRAKIQVLNPSAERELGADACVILQNQSHFKASIFEAKWPRLSTHVNTWDSRQKSTGESHFQSQLLRQRMQRHNTAIWEMFYCEFPFSKQPSYMPGEGSACVWHEDAFRTAAVRLDPHDPWTDDELMALLEAHGIAIADIFAALCECTKGKALPINRYEVAFGDGGAPHEALIISYGQPAG